MEKKEHDGSRYWNAEAEVFDEIYDSEGRVTGLLNKLLRSDMEGRTLFTREHSDLVKAPSILEIGCGTGVHTKLLIEGGASHVTGLDFSGKMLDIARRRLGGVDESKWSLLEGDFMATALENRYDVVTAVGVFDYVAAPREFLKRMADVSQDRVIVTFPRAGTVRASIRKIRLGLKNCPVYFYTSRDIESMAEACGLNIVKNQIIGQLHCVLFRRSTGDSDANHENPADQ